MRISILIGVCAATALFGALPAAAGSFRCGSALVVEGDDAAQVIARCGPPAQVTARSVLRPPVVWINGQPRRVAGGDIEVRIETWVFDFGPGKLKQQVEVESGRVTQIRTL